MTTSTQSYYYGTGKRKTAIARVRLYPAGSGAILVNGKPLEEVMPWIDWQKRVNMPFDRIPAAANRFNVVARITGGGISAWADALRHGIARALLVADPSPQAGPPQEWLPHQGFPDQREQEVRPQARPPSPSVHQALECPGRARQTLAIERSSDSISRTRSGLSPSA